ncbi:MAG: acetylglutamate kinase [Clostridia bacterium]|nr:acetylglutamate kinase [Clostridia bacterium]
MDEKLITDSMKADILIAALPYIQKYYGKTVVVKYGGNAMIDPELKKDVMSDIILLTLVGVKIVLVHGGGPEISSLLGKLGIESKFVNGLRYTDNDTAEVVQMVLAGKTNKDLVSLVEVCGGKAVGLCGIDGGMIRAKKVEDGVNDYGFVGDIVSVDPSPIKKILEENYIPVIATVGSDENGQVYNINADTAAAEIAAALGAENIITLTDIPGLMKDVNDKNSLIPEIHVDEIDSLIENGIIYGGMIPKVRSLEVAVRAGVKKAVMIDGRIPHSILIEMFSNEGIGTLMSM